MPYPRYFLDKVADRIIEVDEAIVHGYPAGRTSFH
jgi:ATPase subunit of ABC transporter with duplicated ATPase domains